MEKLKIIAYTDGSCLGNPGVGGYAAVMRAKGKERIAVGYSTRTSETNNSMELKAVIAVVDWVNQYQKQPCEIEVYTDSQYICNCSQHTKSWLVDGSRKNHELWAELIQKGLAGKHHITFMKVKGHSGDPLNERANKHAYEQARKARHLVYGGANVR